MHCEMLKAAGSSPSSPAAVLEVSTPSVEVEKLLKGCSTDAWSLEGKPCSLEAYFSIPSEFGQYDLWDGVLRFRGMGNDGEHILQSGFFKSKFDTCLRNEGGSSSDDIACETECTVGTGSSAGCLTADFVVGVIEPTNKKPACAKPCLVGEVTSDNRINDTRWKMEMYAQMRIEEYIIVDRKEDCIKLYKLEDDDYEEVGKFGIADTFNHRYFGSFSVRRLLEAKNLSNATANAFDRTRKRADRAEEEREREKAERERAEEERERAEEECEREKAERERAEEEREREKAKREREKAKRKRAEDEREQLRAQVIALGVKPKVPPPSSSASSSSRSPSTLSPSSRASPTRSPPRQRRRLDRSVSVRSTNDTNNG